MDQCRVIPGGSLALEGAGGVAAWGAFHAVAAATRAPGRVGRTRAAAAPAREAVERRPPPSRARVAEAARGGPSDTAVLDRMKRGERRAALELLIEAHGDVVYAFCLQNLKDPVRAEDVRQRVFLKAYESLPSFAGESSLRTWLLGIARYRSLDALRALRREAARFVFDDELLAETAASGPDPHELGGAGRAKGALERCLETCISDEERQLVLLHYRDGLSYEEMSALFGKKPDTLRARVARALPKLRRGLEGCGLEP
jgi:RNA polymerase sigma-70 factor, ECF subfamily